ncbi:MAG: alpha-glucan family phosphorylase, partial [Candidatus Mariimomonas ferrooxydans]
ALKAVKIEPTVCHMNEGHAAFMALERIRQFCQSHNVTFNEAVEATKASNVFTIHTPVKAGLDEFPVELMDKYFSKYFGALGIDREHFLMLGRILPDDQDESFKMPTLAMRLSTYRNGVSKLHGQVTREMWSSIWPGIPSDEVPIVSITNGIHTKGWVSDEVNMLYDRYLGPGWAEHDLENPVWENVDQIPDEELWRTHQICKERLIAFSRKRLKAQIQRRGTYHTELNWAEEVLDPMALTIGFAKRFAGYKRGNLILKDPKRLLRILTNKERPVQFIFSGKAHPRDAEGKEIIRQIIHFAGQYEVRRHIVFLEDYNINIARFLVQGIDVWLNNPRRPLEASGTSGMKAAVNGAINMSTLDGWWCEGFTPQSGWVIGPTEEHDDPTYQDVLESQAIYNLLENEVVPLFYTRTADNLPRAWIRKVKNSIKQIAPVFNTHRMVSEYTQKFYLPAAARANSLTAENLAKAKALGAWKEKIKSAWAKLQISDVKVEVHNGKDSKALDPENPHLRIGSELRVSVSVRLDGISPEEVAVELYHGSLDRWGSIKNGSIIKMSHKQSQTSNGEQWFTGLLRCATPGHQGLAVRVLPRHKDLPNPCELGLVIWEGNCAQPVQASS